MARIYLSSTYSDLEPHRIAVCRTLRQLGHEVIAMEDYVATDQRPVARCLADVAASDLYVGIFAWRYGYRPPHDNPTHKSITELEYRQARQTGKPCLLFLAEESEATAPPEAAADASGDDRCLRELRRELEREHLVSYFRNPDHLASLVSVAVQKWEPSQNKPDRRPGVWGRWLTGLAANLFARRHTKRYLRNLLAQHREFTFLGRAKPLQLENIYVSLKVGEYVSAGLRPDVPAAGSAEEIVTLTGEGRTVEIPEALRLSRRLVVLGDPGAGKTTLLKYLILQMVQRDLRLAEFARTLIPTHLTRWLELTCCFLSGLKITFPALFLGLVAILGWGIGASYSLHPFLATGAGIGVFIAEFLLFTRESSRWATTFGAGLGIGLLLVTRWQAVVNPWAWWLMGGSLVVWFYPIWIQWLLWPLRQLLYQGTLYPIPVFLTLNNLGRDGRSIEDHLADALAELGFPHAQRWLIQRLARGECLLLLDALDEVADPQAQRRVVAEINHLRAAYGEGNQIIVTCRIAGFPRTLNGYYQLEVQALTEAQIAQFVRNWFANTADPLERERRIDGLLRGLRRSPGMRLLATNPLLLSLIALLYECNWRLPERRVELYEEAVNLLIVDWDKLRGISRQPRLLPEQKQQILTQLAACFHAAGRRVVEAEQLRENLTVILPLCGGSLLDPDVVVDELMAHTGLLRQKSRYSYDFVHLTFQEFLTARACQVQWEGIQLLERTGDAWWHEVIRLYAGLKRDATTLLQALRARDLFLAAGCLADCKPLATEAFREAAAALIRDLQQRLQDETQCQAAADALAELTAWDTTPSLTAAVVAAEIQPAVALAALLALARAADKAVLEPLLADVGSILRLLHGQLPQVAPALRPRILTLLDTLGHPLVFVPAGEFSMGSDESEYEYERPVHGVFLTEYWIDQFPVTNAQFAQFVQATGYQAQGNWRSEFRVGKERHPVINVTWDDACAYGNWCGKHLPTEAQWEKAARGTDGRRYPWGNTWDHNKCNVSGRGTTPVDAYPKGVSPYGCQDMIGNVSERVADWFDQNYYGVSPHDNPLGPATGDYRVVRGDSWCSYVPRRTARAAFRGIDNPPNRGFVLGFRLACSSPSL